MWSHNCGPHYDLHPNNHHHCIALSLNEPWGKSLLSPVVTDLSEIWDQPRHWLTHYQQQPHLQDDYYDGDEYDDDDKYDDYDDYDDDQSGHWLTNYHQRQSHLYQDDNDDDYEKEEEKPIWSMTPTLVWPGRRVLEIEDDKNHLWIHGSNSLSHPWSDEVGGRLLHCKLSGCEGRHLGEVPGANKYICRAGTSGSFERYPSQRYISRVPLPEVHLLGTPPRGTSTRYPSQRYIY